MRKMCAQTVICEDIEPSGSLEWSRIARDVEAIKQRLGPQFEFKVTKLTFLCASIDSQSEFAAACAVGSAGFLGHATIVAIKRGNEYLWNYVAESVVRQNSVPNSNQSGKIDFAVPPDHFLHVKRHFTLTCLGHNYELPGSFFCQQNCITAVCAHACATMILNNCNETKTLVCANDLNLHICGNSPREEKIDPHLLKLFGIANSEKAESGLSSNSLEQIFRKQGFEPKKYRYATGEERNFREVLYGFIESGYPAVLTFNTTINNETIQHVASVFGHTLNLDSWFPVAFATYASSSAQRTYLSSLAWVDEFIAHDDNFGMQYSIPAHSFRPEGHPDPGELFAPVEVIGIFPSNWNVRLYGHDAELVAHARLRSLSEHFLVVATIPVPSYYLTHLIPHIVEPKLRTAVFRSTLVTRDQYLAHVSKHDVFAINSNSTHLAQLEKLLQGIGRFWLVEVTEPDLYVGNQSKVIDVLISCESELPENWEIESNFGVVAMNFNGFTMIPSGIQSYDIAFKGIASTKGYWPLFSHIKKF